MAALLLLVTGIGISSFTGLPQAIAQPAMATTAPAAAPANREALLAQLNPQQRQQFEEF